MIKIVAARSPKSIKRYARISLDNSLNLGNTGMMERWLTRYLEGVPPDKNIGIQAFSLAYEEKIPVGCALLMAKPIYHLGLEVNVSVFVSDQHRRKRVGTKLLTRISKFSDVELVGSRNNTRCDGFYGSALSAIKELAVL